MIFFTIIGVCKRSQLLFLWHIPAVFLFNLGSFRCVGTGMTFVSVMSYGCQGVYVWDGTCHSPPALMREGFGKEISLRTSRC